jgi:hypothetical protein
MRHRLAILILVLVLLAPATALAQDGNPFDGQLPPAQPEQTATPAPADNSNIQDQTARTTLYIIGGALLVFFVGIGWWISRDARSNLTDEDRDSLRGTQQRDEGPHKHERQAKAKARAKGRAQKQARKAHRKKGTKAKR